MTLPDPIPAVITWASGDQILTARWRSENGWLPPKRTIIADDTMTADTAYRLASEGVGLIWQGDFQNARQLLQALARRVAGRRVKYADLPYPQRFLQIRLARAQRARTLGMLLLPFEPHHVLKLRRAPDVAQACTEAYGVQDTGCVSPMTELLGVISAHEWRKKGIEVAALDGRIHAHYGVFAPVRAEYLELVMRAPLPGLDLAVDIGTGTGVLAALLAKKGMKRIIATDISPRAIACARQNIEQLGLTRHITLEQTDLFPAGRANLLICNPPWLPGRPASNLEQAVYDLDQRMLNGFLQGARDHLSANGQAWLILSDLAEHLGLRTREDLLAAVDAAGLTVLERLDTRPVHPKSQDAEDPLADARRAEVTSLWRLAAR